MLIHKNTAIHPKRLKKTLWKVKKFREIYDFYRLFKVKEHAKWYGPTDTKKDKTWRRRFREPLVVGERALALA